MSVKQKLITAEELHEMPEVPGVVLELVDGEVIEVPGANDLHMDLMFRLAKRLDRFVEDHDLGLVRPDGMPYVLRRNPDIVRIPDISFVAWDRVPEGEASEFFWIGAPTLAIEIVSPSNRSSDIHRRVLGYLEAGTRQVWVLRPRQRSATVHDADHGEWELDADATLDAGDVLPGFKMRVGDLFDLPRRRR